VLLLLVMCSFKLRMNAEIVSVTRRNILFEQQIDFLV
jgi:hypothetical protein